MAEWRGVSPAMVRFRTLETMALCRIVVTVTLVATALAGCGGGDDATDPKPVARQSASDRADRICSEYRALVTNLHFKGGGKLAVKEIRALVKGTRNAYDEIGVAELGEGGAQFRDTLDRLVPIYARAAAAKSSGDKGGYERAVDRARGLDRDLDRLAGRAGMDECTLGEAESGETRVSEPGFPSMVVPSDAAEASPSKGSESRAYPLSDREALLLSRGPDTRPGIAALDYAEFFYRRSSREASVAKSRGTVGKPPVKMRRFAYAGKKLRGTTYVFSGQGNLWVLLCATRNKKPSGDLKQACSRAARTTGFLMF